MGGGDCKRKGRAGRRAGGPDQPKKRRCLKNSFDDDADREWRAAFEFELASNTRIENVREHVGMNFVTGFLVFQFRESNKKGLFESLTERALCQKSLVSSCVLFVKHAHPEVVNTLIAERLTSGYRDTLPIESKGLDERHLQLAAH